MKKFTALLLGGLTLGQLAILPAEAAAAKSSFHEATVTLHFAGAGGKTSAITEDVYVYGCPAPGVELAERQHHPELAGMRLVDMTCGPPPSRRGLAIITLRFSINGSINVASVDHDGADPITTANCVSVLQKDKSALVARFQGHFPHGTFVDAGCWALPQAEGPMRRIN
jgi:hypothetical protein